jgi:hypothetical protein
MSFLQGLSLFLCMTISQSSIWLSIVAACDIERLTLSQIRYNSFRLHNPCRSETSKGVE